MEVLVSTGRVFDKIADPTQTHELEEIIADGEYYGMQTFDQSLLQPLRRQGRVTRRDALVDRVEPARPPAQDGALRAEPGAG